MLRSATFQTLSVGAFLAFAIAVYIMSTPNEGLLSGPNAFSTLLQSLPLVSF